MDPTSPMKIFHQHMDPTSPMKLFETEVDFILTENARKMLREAEEKDARRHETMYKSPIEIIYQRMQTQVDDDIFRAVQSYNINVDRDELIKALNYDRDQYQKGFEDAKKQYDRGTAHWISDGFKGKCTCSNCGAVPSVWEESMDVYTVSQINKFCRNCGARIIEEDHQEAEE